MKNYDKYKGVFPAFYACYDSLGNISKEKVMELTEYLIKAGVHGVYVGGSSGECIYHSVEERKLVLEGVMEEAKGKITVIAHVACNNTGDSMELASHAEGLGVDAIASIPPIYFRLPEYAIAKYWNDISNAAPCTDFIIYNIPQLAGVALTLPLLKEMLKNPRVVGVKNSSMPTQDIEMFKAYGIEAKGSFVVFNGPDEQLISGLAMGADGGIGGTYGVMPELILKLYSLFEEGSLDKARLLQYDIDSIIYALCGCRGSMYSVIKELIKRRIGIDIGGVRPPMFNTVSEDEEKIEAALKLINSTVEKWI